MVIKSTPNSLSRIQRILNDPIMDPNTKAVEIKLIRAELSLKLNPTGNTTQVRRVSVDDRIVER